MFSAFVKAYNQPSKWPRGRVIVVAALCGIGCSDLTLLFWVQPLLRENRDLKQTLDYIGVINPFDSNARSRDLGNGISIPPSAPSIREDSPFLKNRFGGVYVHQNEGLPIGPDKRLPIGPDTRKVSGP